MTLIIGGKPDGGISVEFDGDPGFLDQCARAIDELLDTLMETAPELLEVG